MVMEHFKLIITLFNLIFGSCTITYLLIKQISLRGVRYFIYLVLHTLGFNLLLVGALLGKYININLPSLFPFFETPLYLQVSQFLFLLLMGIMTYAQWRMRAQFNLSIKSPRERYFTRLYFGVLVSALVVGIVLEIANWSGAYLFLESLGDFLFLTEFILLLLIFRRGLKHTGVREKRLMRSYSLLYLSRYPLIFLMLIIPEAVRFYSSIAVLFLFNLLPLLWALLFFGRGQLNEQSDIFEDSLIAEKLKNQGITKREMEIIQLLLSGKSNKEIEASLFISPHTVKNHIYNIFKKVHVKNRYELMSFMNSFSFRQ